jgi:hypothetical protein
MTRLRDKGGASPQSLYELTNGYVDASGSPRSRPGTRMVDTLPPGTKGLTAFQGKLHVFATQEIDPGNPLFVVNILKHPDASYAGGLKQIHFAKPFLGYLYVVAEFGDGSVWHYYLQDRSPWAANTQYQPGDVVSPSVPNGYIYQATALSTPGAWAPNTQYHVGDVVSPTTPNGWKYTLVDEDGTNPSSSGTEPSWPTSNGAQVNEDTTA